MAAVTGVACLHLSFHFDQPSGPVIALVAVGFFVLYVEWKQKSAAVLQRQRTSGPPETGIRSRARAGAGWQLLSRKPCGV